MKHRWNKNSRVGVSHCKRCGFNREWVKGIPTYFRNDILYDKKAPTCDGLIMGKSNDEIKQLLPLWF